MSNVDELIGKFSNKEVAKTYAEAALAAKKQSKSTCVVDSREWNVLDIKNALLRSANGELARDL